MGEDGTIHVHRLSDRSEIKVVGADRPLPGPGRASRPDGRFLTSSWAVSDIELWDLERGEVPAAWPADPPAWSIRRRRSAVAVLRADGELRVYDLPAMTEAAPLRLGFVMPSGFSVTAALLLSGDGRRLAIVRFAHWEPSMSTIRRGRLSASAVPGHAVRSAQLALDHAGALLAVAHDRGDH